MVQLYFGICVNGELWHHVGGGQSLKKFDVGVERVLINGPGSGWAPPGVNVLQVVQYCRGCVISLGSLCEELSCPEQSSRCIS